MTDQDKQKKIEAALQESAKVEQTLIMAAPILMDMRGVGWFSLPIPGKHPVKYVAAGTLAEIERATRQQDALQQIADFGQEQDACAQMRALCSACGGTGDVHDLTGEWRGSCDCEASAWSREPAAQPAPVAAAGLLAEALTVLDLMLVGCNDQNFGDYQNGDGEEIGPRMDALHAKLRAACAGVPSPVAAGLTKAQFEEIAQSWDGCAYDGDMIPDIGAALRRDFDRLASLAPVAAEPTDIAQRLREYADDPGYSHNDYADTMRAAADEIERYYGGMLAWKKTAEKKDRDWQAERMGRVDDRIAARAAQAATQVPTAAEVPVAALDQAHLPGWERGIATVTMNGHQLREALDFINPDGDDDPEQRENDLTFGIVQHKDDNGIATTGLCCWNDDTDGVLPLDTEPAAPSVEVKGEQGEMGGVA